MRNSPCVLAVDVDTMDSCSTSLLELLVYPSGGGTSNASASLQSCFVRVCNDGNIGCGHAGIQEELRGTVQYMNVMCCVVDQNNPVRGRDTKALPGATEIHLLEA